MKTIEEAFWRYVYRSDLSASWRWLASFCFCLAAIPTLGTIAGAIFVGAAILGVIFVLIAPKRFAPTIGPERIVVAACAGYFLISLLTTAVNAKALADLESLQGPLLILMSAALIPVARESYDGWWSGWLRACLALGPCIALVAGLLGRLVGYHGRLELMLGNPLVLGYVAGLFAVLNAWTALSARGEMRAFHATAALAALIVLLMSQSRGSLVVAAILLAAVLVAALIQARLAILDKFALAYAVIAATVLALAALAQLEVVQPALSRFRSALVYLETPGIAGTEPALERRADMLAAGWRAFLDRPVLGHGRQGVMDAANAYVVGKPVTFTHLHNIYLNELVSSGVVGLLALVALLATPAIAGWQAGGPWRGVGVLVSAYIALFGLTNIGFQHDIVASTFCLFVVVLNAVSTGARRLGPWTARSARDFWQRRIDSAPTN